MKHRRQYLRGWDRKNHYEMMRLRAHAEKYERIRTAQAVKDARRLRTAVIAMSFWAKVKLFVRLLFTNRAALRVAFGI